MYEYVNHGAYSTSNELKHWKYIKKVKGKNGKWKYYYTKEQLKDDLGIDELEAYTDAKNKYENAEQKRIESNRAFSKFLRESRGDSVYEYDYEKSHNLANSSQFWRETAEKRAREYMSARSDVMRTPAAVAVVGIEAVDKGRKFVSNLMKKSTKTKSTNTSTKIKPDTSNRPKGRERNVTGQGKPIKRRGSGLNNR